MDIQTLLKDILAQLTFTNTSISIEENEDHIKCIIEVDEADSGILIGYHGEKIDALQLITNIISNYKSDEYKPIQIDIAGYRERRRQSLEDLAKKASFKALESGREILLPPLPAYERRIIHSFLGDDSQVETYSEGEGRNRRLVVRPSQKTT